MPEIDTAVLTIERAGPDEERRLQSNTVLLLLSFEPMILTNGELLLMITLVSLKYTAARKAAEDALATTSAVAQVEDKVAVSRGFKGWADAGMPRVMRFSDRP